MASMLSDNEAACLDVAISLLERSDAVVATEPRLSRQYACQAYKMGQLSPRLRASIARERIRMIVRDSSQRRISDLQDAITFSKGGWFQSMKKVSFMISLFLAALFLHSTSVIELPDQPATLTARLVDAPL